jgi:putative metallohydrolase (TIGR04338 family)
MKRTRDTQRSRVYAWEGVACRAATGRGDDEPEFDKLEECEEFALPIWRAERGRVGHAKVRAPSIERPNRGQTRAIAHADHRITLPRWARSRWVILHEMAHRLNAGKDGASHGPRFVGILVGLLARRLGLDANLLMRLADEHGVKYHVRSIGVVPVLGAAYHVERALRTLAPMTAMDLACHLSLVDGVDITPSQVRGAALRLIRDGSARWLRGKLVPQGDLLPPKPSEPKAKRVSQYELLQGYAAKHGVEVERDGPGSYWVTAPQHFDLDDSPDDPLEGDHWCAGLAEARDKVDIYINAIQEKASCAAAA